MRLSIMISMLLLVISGGIMNNCSETTIDIIVVFKKDISIEQADAVMKILKLSYHEGMDSSRGKLYFYATGPKFIVKVPLSHKDEFMKKTMEVQSVFEAYEANYKIQKD